MSYTEIEIATDGKGLYEFTDDVANWISKTEAESGLLYALIHNTTASLILLGGADQSLRNDLVAFMDKLAPQNGDYTHDNVGSEDMPSHIKAAVTSSTLTVPIVEGQLKLGARQGLFVFEHRSPAQKRTIGLKFLRG